METPSTERNATFFRFEDLRIYHKALDYIAWVHQAASSFPENPNDNIGVRFNESARAIALNIAEGSARNKSQFIYYLKMAKSSIRESLVITSICKNVGHLKTRQEEESRQFLMELTKMTGALISSLQRVPGGTRETSEVDDEDIPGEPDDFNTDNF